MCVETRSFASAFPSPRTASPIEPWLADERWATNGSPVFRAFGPAPPIVDNAQTDRPVGDVVLRTEGVLEGRVVYRDGRLDAPGAGLPIALLRGRRTIARTTTDVHGRFAFPNVPGGFYRVVIDTGDGRVWRFYRLWTAEAAPPCAPGWMEVVLGGRSVRGQSPIPGGRFPPGAVITAIAAGAIAPPVIYQGIKRNDHIPASP